MEFMAGDWEGRGLSPHVGAALGVLALTGFVALELSPSLDGQRSLPRDATGVWGRGTRSIKLEAEERLKWAKARMRCSLRE